MTTQSGSHWRREEKEREWGREKRGERARGRDQKGEREKEK